MQFEPLPGQLNPEQLRRESYSGWSGPATLQEVLARASKAMDDEDRAELALRAWLAGGPVPQMRHPRRQLRKMLRRRG
ncbi:MAG: hypothetical protein ACLPN6_25365 [Streptosporangiaceae bacterium]